MSEKTPDQEANGTETQANGTPDGKVIDINSQVEKYKNDYLYLRAEFDNYKKNMIKERSDLVKYGSERLINEMLSVLDNFERAQEGTVTAENFENYVKGVKMTAQEFKSALNRFGVTEVNSLGQSFDPSIHEAIGSEESTTIPEGHITKVFRKAYKLHDRLLRPANVVVATKAKN